MKAVIIGASGATGKEVLKQLLSNDLYTEVISLVRRKSAVEHSKLNEIIVDFDSLESYTNIINGDVAFSCLGTTIKEAGSKAAQWKIDFDYQLAFAQKAKENEVKTFVLISSIGAHVKSKFFYTQMKGKLDKEVLNLNFEKTIILQPPSLIRPNSIRRTEKMTNQILSFFNKIGLFEKFKPLHVFDLAQVMFNSVLKLPKGVHILNTNDIKKSIPKSD